MTQPRVVAVIPVMGHPVLLDDAIASAAALLDEGTLAGIVAVDDGCRFDETRAALAAWAALLGPDRMAVLHQPNRGLSAARNAGIAAAMAGAPDAIFLLDADNRLARGAGRAFAALLEAHPEADWFYPAFDFFGQDAHYATDQVPSPLMHMLVNHSEAGSLIRARVFAGGVRFDETLREGYEDWDFFLSAQRVGFSGRPAGRPLLEYRKRPSSMLAGSHDLDAQLRRQIARKHRWLFSAQSALTREHEAFPRFAFVGLGEVALGTDPSQLREIGADAFEAMVLRHAAAPLRHHAPAMTVLGATGLTDRLREAGLLHGLLWAVERRLLAAPELAAVAVRCEGAGEQVGLGQAEGWDGGGTADLLVLPLATLIAAARGGDGALREALNAGDPSGDATLRALAAEGGAERLTLTLPGGGGGEDDARPGAGALLSALARSRFRSALDTAWDWRAPGGAWPRTRAHDAPRLTASGGPVLPLLRGAGGGLDIAFTVSIFDQGGVEKVARAVAREFAVEGHRCHLVVTGGRPARLEHGARPPEFATISFLSDPSAADWAGAEYLGTAETSWGNPEERAALEGLLRPMDVVVNAHSPATHKVAGALRRGGTLMVDHQHVLEVSDYGRAYGPPILTLAYEHAYDAVATCSQGMADWLAAHGVPAEKLIPVVNAPGYPMTGAEVADALALRRDPGAGAPLSVLYLGRLDEQKGIDRVAAIFSRLSEAGRGMALTLAGRAVVNADRPIGPLSPETRLPGPLSTPAALTAAFTAADILVLPSRYEGLPLVVLEAQRLGCVPVVTDVGAVAEAVRGGETGILVPEEGCVDSMVAAILRLDSDRGALAALSRDAAARARDWTVATSGLRAWIAEKAHNRR
ncbi:glycosyltransferase [Paracoccus sp. S-4012]|uniref:glycosyltransferase n=1 Tax=Paracoccus sp. S-4012 TaxID=2665648 RepID=UPI0012AFF2C3|nr:glycosyltransferase [Paracoccus sp. S-4012]MRX51395.1 glycosyltransferase [Paracoccus sp. S-4012]